MRGIAAEGKSEMKVDYASYRQSESEQARIADLRRLLPRGRATVLDIGARDGYISGVLTEYFDTVTALDLEEPQWRRERVVCVQGDVMRLQFDDNAFDTVCCLEVLEHLPPSGLEAACREIARVARHEVIIGVPYRQDLRIGRTRCARCGRTNPPWGHQNSFDEAKLQQLFFSLRLRARSYVGSTWERTNAVAAWLMECGGHPWGTYQQEERCIHCGAELLPPERLSLWQRACAAAAHRINRWESRRGEPQPQWMHCVFEKVGSVRGAGRSGQARGRL